MAHVLRSFEDQSVDKKEHKLPFRGLVILKISENFRPEEVGVTWRCQTKALADKPLIL